VSARHTLLELFDAALRVVEGRRCVAQALRGHARPAAAFAIGKAAASMAWGARDALGAGLESMLVVTKDGHADPDLSRFAGTTVLETAHPVPDLRSLAAGAELERRLASLDPRLHPVFLVSGGSSSLVECLREGVTLDELRALNERGLGSGRGIAALNAERAGLSRLKSGGVARLLAGRSATALFLSDVPGDDPGVIGSGLLGRDGCKDDNILRVVVASVDLAVRQVVTVATTLGLTMEAGVARFEGEAVDVAREFVAALRATRADGLVWGGESTVQLAQRPGRGGRNTHLALAAARLLDADESLTILAAGTDGTDGPTDDAGAVIDARTVERAELAGCDVERAFREFDSGMALEAAEDLVYTGPTGTNVGDLLIGLKRAVDPVRGRPAARML
jgi:hydroxypyruvate reductase